MLQIGDKIKLSGGYDMDPPWLLGHPDGYTACVLRFIDCEIKGRNGDERRSAVVLFDQELEFSGLRSRFGYLLLRYVGQKWSDSEHGVHVHLAKDEPIDRIDHSKGTSRWLESHASYTKTA
jgi:hypothetical protein